MKTTDLDSSIDKHIGESGTKKRDDFENELRLDLQWEAVKNTYNKQ